RLLTPFAPHISEEFWRHLGNRDTVIYAPWPKYDPEKIIEEKVNIPVQVNGKLRGVVSVPRGSQEDEVRKIALQDSNITRHLEGVKVNRVIFVQDRLLNFVVR
ncbi:MAG TPA: class I tRNA ligase family protein, partial [Thermodesulfobacteriota bacterium]|nr:class I tRNA ligase family protein [Thermodesulfobacteriota bacterium]